MTLSASDIQQLTELELNAGPAASDLLPTLPAGASALQAANLGQLAAFVLTSVKAFGAVGDGVTDDTSAIQSAIGSGKAIYFPPGVYLFSSTLVLNQPANHGQVLRGAGPVASDGTGANKTILRPAVGVGVAIQIDGTAFGGYVQGFGIEDLTLDMVNMPDVSASVGVLQGQGFGGRYSNVKMVNYGTVKRTWRFTTGAYTTTLRNCKGNFEECIGTSTGNGVTTILFDNHDGNQLSTIYTNLITVQGGAWQGAGTTKFKFRFGTDFWLKTDVEGSGVFLDVDSSVNGLYTRCQLQGFSGTYMLGAPAPSSIQLDQQVNYNTYPFRLTFGEFHFNAQGNATYSSILSGGPLSNIYLQVGRTSLELLLGVAAAANDFVPGSSPGDAIVGGWAPGGNLFLAAGTIPMAKITPNGFNTFGSGALRGGQIVLNPSSDGADLFVLKTANGTGLVDLTTNATASNSTLAFANGILLLGYSDGFATQSWKINSLTGVIQAGAQIYPGNGTPSAPSVNTASGILGGIGAPSSAIGNNGDFYLRGDGSHGSSNLIYHKEAGSWVGIL